MTTHYDIIVGSMLGASEYVADALANTINSGGNTCTIHTSPSIDELTSDSTWIICTSTHGAGELPDNIQPFAKSLTGVNLTNIRFYVIGLGDSSYDTFCYGAKEMEKILSECNAILLAPPLHIDVLEHPIPEDEAVSWFEDVLENA